MAQPRVALKMPIPSFDRLGYIHAPGTSGTVLEQLNSRIWAIRVEVTEPSGETWTEDLDVLDHEFEFID